MPRPNEKMQAPSRRMATYRQRMRAAGLRPVQIWVPDTRAPGFAEACRAQAAAIAADDPGGEEALRFIEAAIEWPEP
ncbi:antitoxin MazE family protein [Methylobacterium trifolii]|uniref:DUF3018 family protein n=1 Tax=Methylobacterium trifolii TaxID=1003092 RepID=A0ABQ4U2A5_9HYPH|nr:antitoxin MazE family protein [Methylobacterium trifolii]GJE60987.1 hypothetical protein MPOCJGCO_3106 [Methylobacterium trifolii]